MIILVYSDASLYFVVNCAFRYMPLSSSIQIFITTPAPKLYRIVSGLNEAHIWYCVGPFRSLERRMATSAFADLCCLLFSLSPQFSTFHVRSRGSRPRHLLKPPPTHRSVAGPDCACVDDRTSNIRLNADSAGRLPELLLGVAGD